VLAFLDGEDILFEIIPIEVLFFKRGDSGPILLLNSADRVIITPSFPDLAAGIVE
jgi:hypothetical protein